MSPVSAIPAAAPSSSCSAMPTWKNRSGKRSQKMCMSVYLARSADSPTTFGFCSASLTRACPNGAGAVFCPASAMLAIIAEVLALTGLVGLTSASAAAAAASVRAALVLVVVSVAPSGVGGAQRLAGEVPFVLVDADEVRLFPGFQERHTAADAGVADDDRRLVSGRDGVEGVDQGVDVVAVDADGAPPEGFPFVDDGFGAQDPGGRAVGLQPVHVDH